MSAEFDDGKEDGALRTIGEVSKALDIKAHVLRYWEQQFPMLEPLKRSGGRRYYRPEDVQLVERIDYLVNDKGYTIKGAKQAIEEGEKAGGQPVPGDLVTAPAEGDELSSNAPAEERPTFAAPPVTGDTPIADDGGLSSFFGDAGPTSDAVSEQPVEDEAVQADAEPAAKPEPVAADDTMAIDRDEILTRLKAIHGALSEALRA